MWRTLRTCGGATVQSRYSGAFGDRQRRLFQQPKPAIDDSFERLRPRLFDRLSGMERRSRQDDVIRICGEHYVRAGGLRFKADIPGLSATVSGGYSSNPSLQSTTRSSAFGRASLTGYRVWNGDRGKTTLSGYVENTTYVRGRYGSKQIFRGFRRPSAAVIPATQACNRRLVRAPSAAPL